MSPLNTKLTKAQAAAAAKERAMARLNMRDAARAKVVTAAIGTLRPDLETAYICGDLPRWFSSLLGKCEVQAMTAVNTDIHYNHAAFRSTEGQEAQALVFHEAYMPAFAQTFPKLLAKALAKHDAK